MTKAVNTVSSAARVEKGKTTKKERKSASTTKTKAKASAGNRTKSSATKKGKLAPGKVDLKPIVVKHKGEVPEGLPKKYFLKSTFNTQDIMHAPVEKTLKMLDKILAGERLFTM